MASYLDSPMYREMMANTLRGVNGKPQYPGEAIANALATAIQAYSTRQMGKDIETRDNAKADALAQALGPSDNSAWKTGTGMDASGMPAPVSVSPRVGAGIGQRIAATGNRDLIGDMGPAMVQALMGQEAQANAPITPYQQASLDRQDRQFDLGQIDQDQERVDRAMFQSNSLAQQRNELRQRSMDNEAQRDFTAAQNEANRLAQASLAGDRNAATVRAAEIRGAQSKLPTRRDAVALRKEFDAQKDVKDFNDVANSYEVISDIAARSAAATKAGKAPSAADDMSMIFAYMKMLDPGSVVREGEFANAQNTTGIPGLVLNAYNRALSGTRLNDTQRTDFANTAKGVYESRKKRYDQLIEQYRGYERDSGLPEGTIQARIPAGKAPGAQTGGVVKWGDLP